MKTPQLSIVLTVYNMEACLPECLDTIVSQSYRDYEIICVDDGSTDSSLDILHSYAKNDERFSIITQQNLGPGRARNAGMKQACGTYLMLLDSDDIFELDLLEKMVEKAESTQSDIVICHSCEYDHKTHLTIPTEWTVKMEYVPNQDVFSGLDMKGCLFTAFMGWPWDKLYRLDFLREKKLSFPEIENSEDLFFVYSALAKADRLSVVAEALIKHRTNRSDSVSNSRLSAPTCFYEGITLLKVELSDILKAHSEIEWGFLNWALDYTFWNIQSLPLGETRKSLIELLFTDGFPELELDSHVIEYYSLYPDMIRRYEDLRAEYQGKQRKQSIWILLAKAFEDIDKIGFVQTVKKTLRFLRS